LAAAGIGWAIVALCAAFIAVVWGFVFERISYERTAAIQDAVAKNENLVLAFEEHTLRTIKGIDDTALSLKHEYEDNGTALDERRLRQRIANDRALFTSLGIMNEHGDVLRSSVIRPKVNNADRDYFHYHRENADGGLLIGKPTGGRMSGREAIHFTRRVDKPDGSFGGVVLVAVDPAYFSNFYQKVNLGPDGMVHLTGMDAIVRAWRTGKDSTSGHDFSRSQLFREHLLKKPHGSFVTEGRPDGIRRFLSYRSVPGYPLVVAVGSSVEESMAEFNQRRREHLVGASLFTLLIAAFNAGLLSLWSRKRRATADLISSESRYRAAFNQTAIGVSHIALDGTFLKVNRKLVALLGYSENELLGMRFLDLTHPEDVDQSVVLREDLLSGRVTSSEMEKRYRCKDGSVIWTLLATSLVRTADGAPAYFITTTQDITERKLAQERLLRQAHYDNLTGLPNRALLVDRLSQVLKQASRRNSNATVLYVDLDRFKSVNETLGHGIGDLVLQETSARLGRCVRRDDTVARLGGDEFIIVLSDLHEAQTASGVGRKVLQVMSMPFEIEGQELFVTASVGISTYPGDGTEGEILIRNAGAAMFRAKQNGRNTFEFYTAAMNERALENLRLETGLRRAIEREEFLLHFQPKADLESGRITGVEALLRWQSPNNGLVSPAAFIPLLEETGLIVPVGEWVVGAACAQLRAWGDEGIRLVPMAINLSAKQFLHHDICATIDRALQEYALEPHLLEVEITESDAMQNPEKTAAILHRLKARGIRIAIDDFGTGYSSLGYLKKFPADTLKLDRSFVMGLPGDAGDVAIARAVLGMAHSLGLKVVAEGVETEVQKNFLSDHGCDEIQGYLLARPLAPAGFAQRMQREESGQAGTLVEWTRPNVGFGSGFSPIRSQGVAERPAIE
jgi:diguanylate cyclase (GGDEF)-like protein/PAS domain S-box-containing protein